MLSRIRQPFAALGRAIAAHKLPSALIVVAIAAAAVGGYVLATGDDEEPAAEAPAPEVFVREIEAPEEPEELGFPAFATSNTTRIAGADSIANAAAVALAVHPSTGGVPGPDAVSVVDAADWPAAVAAASLVAEPVGAPILLSEEGELPELTASALDALGPKGSAETAGRQAFVVGEAATPDDLESLALEGESAAELAVEVDRLRERIAGKPEHIVLASSADPAFAMPAAAWAARSGDPVLFVGRDSVPAPTRKALERYEDVAVYALGPERAISAKVIKEVEDLAPGAQRIAGDDPVANAIEFARYSSGSFGWNINDPGHGFVIATAERPLDAAAAAPLSASGTWGPLLLTERGGSIPPALRGYLLDLKPGYEGDPTRALYNHIWLIGDPEAISVGFQAQVDEIAEVAPVTSGSGAETLVPGPGTVESSPDEPEPQADDGGKPNR